MLVDQLPPDPLAGVPLLRGRGLIADQPSIDQLPVLTQLGGRPTPWPALRPAGTNRAMS
jgi:hypothetical protein